MKVLQVSPTYYPAHRTGGPIKSVHGLSRELVAQDAAVVVFTSDLDGYDRLDVPLEKPVDLDGVTVFYFPVTRPHGYVHAPKLGRMLQQRVQEFDLVHINGLYLYPGMAAGRACRRRGVPYIIAPRGMLIPQAIALGRSWRKRLYLRLIEVWNLKGAAALHFTSAEEQRLATSSGRGRPTFVVPNALDLADFPPPTATRPVGSPNGQDNVLFLSRIHPIKGLDLLIPAFAQVVAARPWARLQIVGPDEAGYLAQVQALVASHGLEECVTFPGMLLGQAKLDVFQAASLFVLPSYSESFGIVVIEAMACGKPVVITDRVNIWQDVQQAEAGLVTRCDPAEIAEAILSLLADPTRGRQMGHRGRKLVEDKFTWERAAKDMLQNYRQILGHSL